VNENGRPHPNRQPSEQPHDRHQEQPGRTMAEWVSLGLSLAVIAALLGLLGYAHVRRGDEPAAIEVQPQLEQVRLRDGAYYVPVEIKNTGGKAAEELRVPVTLTAPGAEPETATITLHLLAGGEAHQATVVFRGDPRRGRVASGPVTFVEP
jgi:uncharacterized protein (TIGR02588 family)